MSMKIGNASVRVARTTISVCCFALPTILLSTIIQPASGFSATIHHRRRSNPPILSATMSSAEGTTEDQPMVEAAKSGDANFSNFSRTNNIPTFDGDEKAKATDFGEASGEICGIRTFCQLRMCSILTRLSNFSQLLLRVFATVPPEADAHGSQPDGRLSRR